MQDQLRDHLLKEGLIDPPKHGVIRTRSCSISLTDLFDAVTSIHDQKQLMVVLYFDIIKDCDRVLPNLPIKTSVSLNYWPPIAVN